MSLSVRKRANIRWWAYLYIATFTHACTVWEHYHTNTPPQATVSCFLNFIPESLQHFALALLYTPFDTSAMLVLVLLQRMMVPCRLHFVLVFVLLAFSLQRAQNLLVVHNCGVTSVFPSNYGPEPAPLDVNSRGVRGGQGALGGVRGIPVPEACQIPPGVTWLPFLGLLTDFLAKPPSPGGRVRSKQKVIFAPKVLRKFRLFSHTIQ